MMFGEHVMDRWLEAALAFIPSYLDYQLRMQHHPGCVVAVAQRNKVIFEHAFGFANMASGEPMTPRHRFRVASHSKSFTAAGVMKLREQNKVHLDARAGDYVKGLHKQSALARIGQLLSHSAGFVRDGLDSGYFVDRRPFFNERELLADLANLPPSIEAGTRFKYSNHGYGLLGQVIASVTGESYNDWIRREIVEAVGLKETAPDMPIDRAAPLASGHTGEFPLGRRAVIPGRMPAHALASATGFVATAADLALFFNQLSPASRRSVLAAESRREMTRRHWRNPDTALEGYYGLGTINGSLDGWSWFGHSGAMPGYITRTATLVEPDVTVSILTNAIDGWAGFWMDSVFSILRAFERNGAPTRQVRDWTGRWTSMWRAIDLVPMGNKVVMAMPSTLFPFANVGELHVSKRDLAQISRAEGFGSFGEPVRRVRKRGKVAEVWIGSAKCIPERELGNEIKSRYRLAASNRSAG
jgi:CubicO group peptidase (beta-lactamase class C family)